MLFSPLCSQPLKSGRNYNYLVWEFLCDTDFVLSFFEKTMRCLTCLPFSKQQASNDGGACLTTDFLANKSLYSTRLYSTSACTISKHETGNHHQSAMFDGRKANQGERAVWEKAPTTILRHLLVYGGPMSSYTFMYIHLYIYISTLHH